VRPNLTEKLDSIPLHGGNFTIDLWGNKRRIGVIGIRIHFISDDWKQEVITIALVEMSESHTSENIKSKFNEILDSYSFDRTKVWQTRRRVFNYFLKC
jgi:hypothetical protein